MSGQSPLSPERANYLQQVHREHRLVRGSRAAIVIVFFALWEIAAYVWAPSTPLS